MIHFVISIIAYFMMINYTFADECTKKQITFDIGSGSIKTAGFEYDVCKNKVLERLGSFDQSLKYELCIEEESDQKLISSECINRTNDIISNIEKNFGAKCDDLAICKGVATAWARKAANSEEVLDLYRARGVDVKLLSQKEEGELGFKTVAKVLDIKNDANLIVFDIGGASFQLSTKTSNSEIEVFNGPDGVESFNKKLKKHFGNKLSNEQPYMNAEQIKEITAITSHSLKKVLDQTKALSQKLKSKKSNVIAIGRPMYIGLRHQLNFPETFNKKQLLETALQFSNKSPKQVHDLYPRIAEHFLLASQASLIYVYSIMEATGIDSMTIAVARPTDYLAEATN